MTTPAYTEVLDIVERLPLEEQAQLLAELAMRVQQRATPQPLTDDKRAHLDAWFATADALAAKIGAAWKNKDLSAVDAVREQRRDL